MDLFRIDIQDEGSFVLECNSGQQLVAAFQEVSHERQLKLASPSTAMAPSVDTTGRAIKTKVFAATVAKVGLVIWPAC